MGRKFDCIEFADRGDCRHGAQVDESVVRLARVGIENVKGYLEGGVENWQRAGFPVDSIAQVSVNELKEKLATTDDLQVVDVRRPTEYGNGHVPRALNAPLATLDRERRPVAIRKRQTDRGDLCGWLSFERGGKFVGEAWFYESAQRFRRHRRLDKCRLPRRNPHHQMRT